VSVRLRVRAVATVSVVGLLIGMLVGVGTSATAGQRPDWSTRAVPPPAPGHVDPAPPGVDVRRHLRTDEMLAKARARTERRLAELGRGSTGRRGQPRAAAAEAPTAEAGAPAGLSALPGLAGHVAPSCSGTGTDGNRVQVIYAVESDDPDRYDAVLPILRQEIANVDDTFALSAAKDGGGLRVRWVFDPATCAPVIAKVRVGKGELASFAGTITALQRAGWTDSDRKYLVFADAAVLCGVGHLYVDDRAIGNPNDGGAAMYSRVDTGCWQATSRGSTVAHELMHNLGGIQVSAGHSTPYGHCSDDNDLMCYADGSGVAMRQICPVDQEPLFDCREDDYFATSPAAGSYLATRWNTARSSFLDPAPPLPEPDPPADGGAALTVAVAGPASVRPGLPAALAASGSDEGAYVWVVDRPHCVVGPTTGATLTVQCPTYETGSVRATVVLTDSGGRTATDTHDVALTGPAAPLPLTLTPSAPSRYVGQAVRVTARVGSATHPVRGWVQMWSSTDGRNWTTIAGPGDTGPDGVLAVTARPRRTTYFQVAVAVSGSGGWVRPGHVIEEVRVTRWPVRLGASARAGRPDVLTARLTNRVTGGPLAGRKVVLQKRFPGRSWRNIRTVTTGPGSSPAGWPTTGGCSGGRRRAAAASATRSGCATEGAPRRPRRALRRDTPRGLGCRQRCPELSPAAPRLGASTAPGGTPTR
jgi:hypothetical protein